MKLTENKDGTIIEIYVKPNQPKFKITVDGDELVVYATEEPVKGKVNKEIVKELSKLFNANVEIVTGATSKQKHLLIKDKSKQEIEHFLQRAL